MKLQKAASLSWRYFSFLILIGVLYYYVTCNSVIKLQQTRHNVRLHSHEVQYGSGSGQQAKFV